MGDEIGRNSAYFYCLKHATVEGEDECKATDRLGPFPTPAAAAAALETIHEREDRKNAEDAAWRDA